MDNFYPHEAIPYSPSCSSCFYLMIIPSFHPPYFMNSLANVCVGGSYATGRISLVLASGGLYRHKSFVGKMSFEVHQLNNNIVRKSLVVLVVVWFGQFLSPFL